MNTPDETPIDFSPLHSLEPRPGSFEKMLERRKRLSIQPGNTIPFPSATPVRARNYWPRAAAALFIAAAGFGIWLGVSPSAEVTAAAPPTSATVQTTLAADSASVSAPIGEAVEWFGALGKGASSTPLMVADALFQAF